MATIRLEVVTPEKMVFSGDVDMILAWGVEGQLGILPHHAPLMTMLQPGDLVFRRSGQEESLVVSGGSLEVCPDKVVVLGRCLRTGGRDRCGPGGGGERAGPESPSDGDRRGSCRGSRSCPAPLPRQAKGRRKDAAQAERRRSEVVHPRSSFRAVIIDGQTTCHGVTAGRRDNVW